jgi:DNA polymerase-3 subunit epsilon
MSDQLSWISPLHDASLNWVAFDTETTGKYPLESEICEIAAVKVRGGQVIDTFQSLIKPRRPMGAEVIAIHGISNEMVADAPSASEVLTRFRRFVEGALCVAHHAPFDLGFVSAAFEELGLELPRARAFCSSLLARALVPESANHKLQTLVRHFNLDGGQAHRALDDAKACWGVFAHAVARLPEPWSLETLEQKQGRPLEWERFSLRALAEERRLKGEDLTGEWPWLFSQLRNGPAEIRIIYLAGSRPGQPRDLTAIGLIRSPEGDSLIAREPGQQGPAKRFAVAQITSLQRLG